MESNVSPDMSGFDHVASSDAVLLLTRVNFFLAQAVNTIQANTPSGADDNTTRLINESLSHIELAAMFYDKAVKSGAYANYKIHDNVRWFYEGGDAS